MAAIRRRVLKPRRNRGVSDLDADGDGNGCE
jgi:hypothetical protein